MKDIQKTEAIKKVRELVLDDPAKRERFEKFQTLAKPIIQELTELGYNIQTLGDLRHTGKPWKSALPALLRWLPKVDDPGVKEEIVRCLSVPWLGDAGTALLIEEFKKCAPVNELLAWTIGNALSIVDVKRFEAPIIKLCQNAIYGMTRQMLVAGLGRFHAAEAENTALQLLRDDSVKLHAVIALGKMKSRQALPALEKLLTDKNAGIRKEARKAIESIGP